MILEIYTDGSFYQGIGGWASVFVAKEKGQSVSKYICGYETDTTSNRMELRAVIESVKALRRTDYKTMFDKISLYSDSQYVIKAIDHWATRSRHKNVDLWKEYQDARIGMEVKIEYNWMRGHTKTKANPGDSRVHWNDTADKLASEARIHTMIVSRLQPIT